MTHVVRGLPAAVVVGAESEDAYLARQVPSYRAWQFINTRLAPDSRILAFASGDQLYAKRPRLWSDSAAAHEITWGTPAGLEPVALDAAKRQGITHVLLDKRQLEDGSVKALAIGSDRMRACCLTEVYQDNGFVLYAVGAQPLSPSSP